MDTSERRFLARDNPGMTHSTEDLHVYVRHINANERTSLSVLAQWIPQGATVLDLGCGSGALGQYLAQHRACTTDGITWSEAEAAHARPHYRRVEVADLETADLHTLLAGQRYDRIVCADVLEHLRQPERILDTCRALLAPDGQLLISVPNAAYCGLVAELLHGEFRYRDEGLLDRTHLRFFTRTSLLRLLHEQGWAVDALDTIRRELPESEFGVAFDRLPPAAARYLLAGQDALTYQFIGAVRPRALGQTAAEAAAQSPSRGANAQALFTAQLYVTQNGQFQESHKFTSTGAIGTLRQTLRFTLPATHDTAPRLRLDPADRPGFLHLHAITLRTSDGLVRWRWSPTSTTAPEQTLPGASAHRQIMWHPPLPTAPDTVLLLLTGDDPWLELPIPVPLLAQTLQEPGATLSVELGWPMSADYLTLGTTVSDLQAQITHMETALVQAQKDRIQASAALAANAAQIQHLTHAQQQYEQLQLEQQQLQAHLHSIENSTVFRATRPIVRAKMRLDRLLGRSHPATSMAEFPPPVTPPPTLTPPSKAAPPATAETTTATLAAEDQANTPEPVPASTVDIIVPVYRGLADTQLCVNSVLASTCATPYRLVIINDASPEPEVTTWLRERAAQEPRITLLENPENLGFVGTVNRGMALSDSHDVLLLNSDTEVANDWLDRIRRAAYSDRKVASVTPFSNNATICSYPKFCQDNRLPRGYDTARMDALCAQTNPGAVVDVPTGVGFCMYIRRDCLAQVGLFDTTHFGKGYGEENDFCQRAAQAGWRNLHLLDTFVLHTGGVSFGASKSPREQAAMETLRRLHPHYETDVQTFVVQDPARPYRHALDFARMRASALPRILTVLHNAGGGTRRHTEELATYLHDKVISLSLIPLADHMVRLTWNSPHEALCQTYHWPTQSQELLTTLRSIGVCHMHYHHLLGVNPEIMLIPTQLGITYDFTAHDYYAACPQISLTDSGHNYCGERGLAQCSACLAQRPAPTTETIEDWRLRHRLFLRNARYLLTPSRDAAERLHRYFPSARLRFAPHLDIAADSTLPPPQPRRLAPGAYLRVLVIGAVNEIKGANTLEATAFQAAQNASPLEFHLVGYAHRPLQTQPHASLTIHGAYADSDLPRLLERLRPDIVWFPARWPETYSYTLSACLLAGVPIMAPNLGAFPERLSQRPWTWIRPWETNAQTWVEIFETLRNQHFVTGQPPPLAPEFIAALPESSATPWSYTTDYLDHLGAAQTPPAP
ncbi:GT2 family glycosyltransferase [Simplicispira metamorpha]|uniref:GT2 family glycosyltransferase n=3 Tax=Simplicispira metamorpha TaxID=80881 RepID=A0A4V2SJM8_9BURK|nr:GT2 family glycosyltransferase [Simplicispira metamorpha]